MQLATVLAALEEWKGGFCLPEELWIHLELTLGSKRRHVLVTSAMNLVAIGIHCKDQDHDASHDASSHGAHGGAFNHVQCDHLVTFVKTSKQTSLVKVSQVR